MDVIASEWDENLGVTFSGEPPKQRVVARQVAADTWGEAVGVREGTVLLAVNFTVVESISNADFWEQLACRPLALTFSDLTLETRDDEPLGLKLVPSDSGAAVSGVRADSWAERVGVLVGWEVVEINDCPAAGLTTDRLAFVLESRPVEIRFQLAGSDVGILECFADAAEDELGLCLRSDTPGRLVVAEIRMGFWAYCWGIRQGDVIVGINGVDAATMPRNEFDTLLQARPLYLQVSTPAPALGPAAPPPRDGPPVPTSALTYRPVRDRLPSVQSTGPVWEAESGMPLTRDDLVAAAATRTQAAARTASHGKHAAREGRHQQHDGGQDFDDVLSEFGAVIRSCKRGATGLGGEAASLPGNATAPVFTLGDVAPDTQNCVADVSDVRREVPRTRSRQQSPPDADDIAAAGDCEEDLRDVIYQALDWVAELERRLTGKEVGYDPSDLADLRGHDLSRMALTALDRAAELERELANVEANLHEPRLESGRNARTAYSEGGDNFRGKDASQGRMLREQWQMESDEPQRSAPSQGNRRGAVRTQEPFPFNPTEPASVVSFALKVQNLNYSALVGRWVSITAFEAAVKRVVSREVGGGLLPEHVGLHLFAGSITVNVVVTPPAGLSTKTLRSKLSMRQASLSGSLAVSLAREPRIARLAKGPIGIACVGMPKATRRRHSAELEHPIAAQSAAMEAVVSFVTGKYATAWLLFFIAQWREYTGQEVAQRHHKHEMDSMRGQLRHISAGITGLVNASSNTWLSMCLRVWHRIASGEAAQTRLERETEAMREKSRAENLVRTMKMADSAFRIVLTKCIHQWHGFASLEAARVRDENKMQAAMREQYHIDRRQHIAERVALWASDLLKTFVLEWHAFVRRATARRRTENELQPMREQYRISLRQQVAERTARIVDSFSTSVSIPMQAKCVQRWHALARQEAARTRMTEAEHLAEGLRRQLAERSVNVVESSLRVKLSMYVRLWREDIIKGVALRQREVETEAARTRCQHFLEFIDGILDASKSAWLSMCLKHWRGLASQSFAWADRKTEFDEMRDNYRIKNLARATAMVDASTKARYSAILQQWHAVASQEAMRQKRNAKVRARTSAMIAASEKRALSTCFDGWRGERVKEKVRRKSHQKAVASVSAVVASSVMSSLGACFSRWHEESARKAMRHKTNKKLVARMSEMLAALEKSALARFFKAWRDEKEKAGRQISAQSMSNIVAPEPASLSVCLTSGTEIERGAIPQMGGDPGTARTYVMMSFFATSSLLMNFRRWRNETALGVLWRRRQEKIVARILTSAAASSLSACVSIWREYVESPKRADDVGPVSLRDGAASFRRIGEQEPLRSPHGCPADPLIQRSFRTTASTCLRQWIQYVFSFRCYRRLVRTRLVCKAQQFVGFLFAQWLLSRQGCREYEALQRILDDLSTNTPTDTLDSTRTRWRDRCRHGTSDGDLFQSVDAGLRAHGEELDELVAHTKAVDHGWNHAASERSSSLLKSVSVMHESFRGAAASQEVLARNPNQFMTDVGLVWREVQELHARADAAPRACAVQTALRMQAKEIATFMQEGGELIERHLDMHHRLFKSKMSMAKEHMEMRRNSLLRKEAKIENVKALAQLSAELDAQICTGRRIHDEEQMYLMQILNQEEANEAAHEAANELREQLSEVVACERAWFDRVATTHITDEVKDRAEDKSMWKTRAIYCCAWTQRQCDIRHSSILLRLYVRDWRAVASQCRREKDAMTRFGNLAEKSVMRCDAWRSRKVTRASVWLWRNVTKESKRTAATARFWEREASEHLQRFQIACVQEWRKDAARTRRDRESRTKWRRLIASDVSTLDTLSNINLAKQCIGWWLKLAKESRRAAAAARFWEREASEHLQRFQVACVQEWRKDAARTRRGRESRTKWRQRRVADVSMLDTLSNISLAKQCIGWWLKLARESRRAAAAARFWEREASEHLQRFQIACVQEWRKDAARTRRDRESRTKWRQRRVADVSKFDTLSNINLANRCIGWWLNLAKESKRAAAAARFQERKALRQSRRYLLSCMEVCMLALVDYVIKVRRERLERQGSLAQVYMDMAEFVADWTMKNETMSLVRFCVGAWILYTHFGQHHHRWLVARVRIVGRSHDMYYMFMVRHFVGSWRQFASTRAAYKKGLSELQRLFIPSEHIAQDTGTRLGLCLTKDIPPIVQEVAPGSWAKAEGIAVDSVLVEVNGTDTTTVSPHQLERMLVQRPLHLMVMTPAHSARETETLRRDLQRAHSELMDARQAEEVWRCGPSHAELAETSNLEIEMASLTAENERLSASEMSEHALAVEMRRQLVEVEAAAVQTAHAAEVHMSRMEAQARLRLERELAGEEARSVFAHRNAEATAKRAVADQLRSQHPEVLLASQGTPTALVIAGSGAERFGMDASRRGSPRCSWASERSQPGTPPASSPLSTRELSIAPASLGSRKGMAVVSEGRRPLSARPLSGSQHLSGGAGAKWASDRDARGADAKKRRSGAQTNATTPTRPMRP